MLKRRYAARAAQCGLSLIELMVGIAIGLLIVAAASLVMTSQLIENRRLLSETVVQQDLRAASDIILRDLRRAGYDSEGNVLNSLWFPGSPGTTRNFMASSLSTSASRIDFDYFVGPGVIGGPFAYEKTGTTVKTRLGGAMQDLTDPNAMKVTALNLATAIDTSATIPLPCPTVCAGPTPTACWPRYLVRKAQVGIEAEAKSDDKVKRGVGATVRVRNDLVSFSNAPMNLICPAS